MRILVTCGPGFEPIDYVRRITNFSTGELGLMLASALAEAGHETILLKGEAATSNLPHGRATICTFSTNDDLVEKMRALHPAPDLIFHAAALADFRVTGISDEQGRPLIDGKIPSTHPKITLTLEPATKVIGLIPEIFPNAQVIGWKYETDGSRIDAIGKGIQQLTKHQLGGTIINGPAWGNGFGFVRKNQAIAEANSKAHLCNLLLDWIKQSGIKSGSAEPGREMQPAP